MSQSPPPHAGMHHVALNSSNFEATRKFYVEIFGYEIEWEPDGDNVYLTSGTDNLAIHRSSNTGAALNQTLDHVGLLVNNPAEVDQWHEYLVENQVEIVAMPRTHRDGARSFYCKDPDGNTVQVIYHPPLATSSD